MAENQQEMEARRDLFAGVAEEGKEDLLAELDEMEADELGKELDELMLPSGPVADPIGPVRNDPLPQQA